MVRAAFRLSILFQPCPTHRRSSGGTGASAAAGLRITIRSQREQAGEARVREGAIDGRSRSTPSMGNKQCVTIRKTKRFNNSYQCVTLRNSAQRTPLMAARPRSLTFASFDVMSMHRVQLQCDLVRCMDQGHGTRGELNDGLFLYLCRCSIESIYLIEIKNNS